MNMKGYYEFIMSVSDESREAIMYKLAEMGSTGFFEKTVNIASYFEGTSDITALCDELEQFRGVLRSSGLDPDFSYDYILLPEKDWNEEWKKSFKPINVGENLTIVPSWLQDDSGRTSIIIDPGMAFGTGHHETTKRCLMILERLSKGGQRSLLDVGTGTGILAIGAAKLGMGPVTGVDIDPLAIELALRNAEMNELPGITMFEGGIERVAGSYDVIMANLISELLIKTAHEIAKRLSPGGKAILSGMITGQETGVIKVIEKAGLALENKYVDEKWVTLLCRG
jgi:ribosomal protein L11 methyltransferase